MQQSGFARSVSSDDADTLTAFDIEAHIFERMELLVKAFLPGEKHLPQPVERLVVYLKTFAYIFY